MMVRIGVSIPNRRRMVQVSELFEIQKQMAQTFSEKTMDFSIYAISGTHWLEVATM